MAQQAMTFEEIDSRIRAVDRSALAGRTILGDSSRAQRYVAKAVVVAIALAAAVPAIRGANAQQPCDARRADGPVPPAPGTGSSAIAVRHSDLSSHRSRTTQIVENTDTQCGTTSELITTAKVDAAKAIEDRKLSLETASVEVARLELQRRWQALSAAEQVQHAALRDAVDAVIPAVVGWRRRIQAAPVGPVMIKYDYPGSGDYRVQLTVVNRLGNDYEPNRWVGTSADIAVARPRFRAIQGSVGIGGVFGKRVETSLSKISKPATPDTFKLVTREIHKFSYLPITLLSGQRAVRKWGPDVVAGLSVGLGLKGDEINKLGQATDFVGALTFGFDWLRASFGGAYTAEVVGVSGIGADGLTTDPSALNNPNLDRKFRWLFALHIAR